MEDAVVELWQFCPNSGFSNVAELPHSLPLSSPCIPLTLSSRLIWEAAFLEKNILADVSRRAGVSHRETATVFASQWS